jgi:hypothetical protein
MRVGFLGGIAKWNERSVRARRIYTVENQHGGMVCLKHLIVPSEYTNVQYHFV